MPEPTVPAVGTTVHYVSHGTPVRHDGTQEYPPKCRAAITTDAAIPTGVRGRVPFVRLAVLNPSGLFFTEYALPHLTGDNTEPGSWHHLSECEGDLS